MALDTRLIGQALGLGRPADVAGAMEPAIQKGEKIFAEQRARREREQVRARKEQIRQEDNTARAINVLSNIDPSGVAAEFRPVVMKAAKKVRQRSIDAIKASNNPVQQAEIAAAAEREISMIKGMSNDYNAYVADIADVTPDDISKINAPELSDHVGKMIRGEFEITDDFKFDFKDGKDTSNWSDVINKKYINKRSDKYLELLNVANKTAIKFGSDGSSRQFYMDNLNNGLDAVKLSDLDALSVLIDHVGYDDPKKINPNNIPLIERAKEDFDEDGRIDNIKDKAALRDLIKTTIKGAYESTFLSNKAEYDRKLKIKNAGKTETDYYGDAASMLQSVYDKLPTSLSATRGQQDEEIAAIKTNKDLTKKEKEEKLKEINKTSKSLTTRAVIDIVKEEPIFGDSVIEDPGAAKEATVESMVADEDLNWSKQEAEKFYDEKYGNPLVIINGKPVNDINGLVSAYNRTLSSTKSLTNSQMKEIINNLNIGTDTTSKTDYSQYKTN